MEPEVPMKAFKALLAIGLIIFLIVVLVMMVNQFIGVKKAEPAIRNLPKIKKEIREKTDEREEQIRKAAEAEEQNREPQE